MSTSHGRFVWYELMTTDAAAATEFYSSVIGWTARDAGMSDKPYTILSAGETMVGGLLDLPQSARDAGGRPGWIGYVAVGNVDDYATRVRDAGGTIHHAPEDIPGVGRFAVAGDPQKAAFVLFSPADTGQAPPPAARDAPGHVGWRELQAADWQAAFAFYSDLFGWTKGDAIDMGPMGTYQIFASGDAQSGGMMTKVEADSRPFWLYYFNVAEIDAAVARVKDAGGQVVHGPQQVPGGSWIAQGIDPQGVLFAMVAPARG